ncbi:hypothetical protein [Burkholderia cenocepacia]|uniref:hypothetical protein n=1 Tax=Burkholderia cenocepacia TaxID=95486 RepID=UPI00285E5C5E|nr:hypothetical protein [Burkholderia cenocepacia]MDR5645490.1 hypothetical protein [Burkholderia cenocepacia]
MSAQLNPAGFTRLSDMFCWKMSTGLKPARMDKLSSPAIGIIFGSFDLLGQTFKRVHGGPLANDDQAPITVWCSFQFVI